MVQSILPQTNPSDGTAMSDKLDRQLNRLALLFACQAPDSVTRRVAWLVALQAARREEHK